MERERVKALLRQGRNPVQTRALNKATAIAASDNTFDAIAMDWLDSQPGWSSPHYEKSKRAIERDVLSVVA